MSKQVFFISFILYFSVLGPLYGQQLPDSILLTAGKAVEIESEELSQTRKILIHHPIFFDENQEYPLIVVLDGEMAFKSFASITELMGFQELIPHCIVVGIPNIDRNGDHAPNCCPTWRRAIIFLTGSSGDILLLACSQAM